MIHIGIDPGASGAIALIDSTKPKDCNLTILRNDWTDHDLARAFEDVTSSRGCHAVIEKVHAMPKQGVTSTFKFGESFGKLQMLLVAWQIPFEFVTPQKWQTAMQCKSGGDKNVTKAAAQRLYPDYKITHRNADAILIAEYARRLK